jgi:hypothetical protein
MEIDGQPHWRVRFQAELWPAFEDFRNFVCLVWDHLGLPSPTRAQLEVAHRLQYGADTTAWLRLDPEDRACLLKEPREDVVRAFRFLGKSFISSAFVIWRLMRNPRDEHCLILSATGSKAKEFVDMTKGLLQSLDCVTWLLEGSLEGGARRRDMADRFDVGAASIKQSFSVKAVGIDGQITGSRATLLLADDIEIPGNSGTEEARGRVLHKIRSDFPWITRTNMGKGDILFLGTPQTEESVYNVLVKEMGYACFTIPARVPAADKLKNYILETIDHRKVDILAPYLRADLESGVLAHGDVTDGRFSVEDLEKEEAKGRSHFALQMMLDTSLSDAERYPLKQFDLIVLDAHHTKAPLMVQWGHEGDKKNRVQNIPNLGFAGDHLLRPLKIDTEWRPYEGKVLWVDPAGRGKDECAWCVMGQLAGTLFVLRIGSHKGDPAEAMVMIAADAKRYDVNVVEVEPNFGQGMWVAGFQPILTKLWNDKKIQFLNNDARISAKAEARKAKIRGEVAMGGCSIQESEWAVGQKEVRIIDTLEPVMTAHRLVISEEVLKLDVKSTEENYVYSFLRQLTHLTRDRRSLRHDDRVECVAGAVGHFIKAMEIDHVQAKKGVHDAEKDLEIEHFIEDFNAGFNLGAGRGRGRRGVDGVREEVTQVKL